MSIYSCKTIKIVDTTKSHQDYYGDKYITSQTKTITSYNINDTMDHSIKYSPLLVLIVPDLKYLVRFLKVTLISSLIVNILGMFVLIPFSDWIGIYNYFDMYKPKDFIFIMYLNTLPFVCMIFLTINYPNYIKSKFHANIKKKCHIQRDVNGNTFDEDLFDREFKVVKDSKWNSFYQSLM